MHMFFLILFMNLKRLTSKRENFEKQYKIRMKKSSEHQIKSTMLSPEAKLKIENNRPEVTIENL